MTDNTVGTQATEKTITARESMYRQCHDEIAAALVRVKSLLDAHAVAATANDYAPNWAEVGDLWKVRDMVSELTAFLSGDSE